MLAATIAAPGQSLARLTVQSFTLSADTAHPRVDVPFRLILTLRVRERLTAVANLELPMLAQLDLLGDERTTVAGPRGTQYRETITVVAHSTGTIAIAPATLQAIDAHDGKPKQWFSNGLSVGVLGAPPLRRGGAALLRLFGAAVRVLFWVLGIAAILAILAMVVAVLGRRPRRAQPAPLSAPMASPPPLERSRREELTDALTVLRAERTRSAALAVRNAVWRMLGARSGATLGDVLGRRESGDPTMRELLIALERSAFTYDEDVPAAIDDACAALERSIGSLS